MKLTKNREKLEIWNVICGKIEIWNWDWKEILLVRGVERVAGEDCGEEGGEADHQQWPSRAENILFILYFILFFSSYILFSIIMWRRGRPPKVAILCWKGWHIICNIYVIYDNHKHLKGRFEGTCLPVSKKVMQFLGQIASKVCIHCSGLKLDF